MFWPTLAAAATLIARAPLTDPIVTDRPDFTESSSVVPLGKTQIESGLTWTKTDSQNSTLNGPELLIRRSLTENVELRIGLPNYNWVHTSGTPPLSGFDDTYLGFKFHLGECKGTSFAFIPAAVLPSGREGIRSEATALDLKLVWGRSLPNDLSLSGMIYYSNPQEGGKRSDVWEHTLSLGVPVREHLGMFVEHVLDVSRGARPAHLLHTGFAYQPNPNSQFDLHFGFGLTGNAPRAFLGMGYSIRF